MPLCVLLAVGHGEHGHGDIFVFILSRNGQGPEVGRRPSEDNQHKQQGTGFHRSRDGRPAKERGRSAEEAPDHDVLRRRALQPEGIDEAIAHPGRKVQPGRKRIHESKEHHHAQGAGGRGKGRALGEGHPSGRHGAMLGAGHARIDLRIGQMVHRCGGSGHQGDAQERPKQ